MVNFVDDTAIYTVIPSPLSRPQVRESINQDSNPLLEFEVTHEAKF